MSSKEIDLKVLRTAREQAEQFSQELMDTAAQQGVSLVVRGSVVPVSEFPDWPTKMAEALCKDPALATKTNEELVSAIEARSGKTGFNSKLISKKLSALQHSYVSDILRQHGYSPSTLVKGTDIKRIVKNQVRLGTTEATATEVRTIFYADGVSVDGRTHKYRQRNTTPTGNPWYDFCIRIGNVDTPLSTVLVLRRVSIGEFQNKDEAAVRCATPEQMKQRRGLDRESQVHRGLSRLTRQREVGPDYRNLWAERIAANSEVDKPGLSVTAA